MINNIVTDKRVAFEEIKNAVKDYFEIRAAEEEKDRISSVPWYELSLSEIDEYYDDNLRFREWGDSNRHVKYIALSDELKNDKEFISEVKELISSMGVDDVSYILNNVLGIKEEEKSFNH